MENKETKYLIAKERVQSLRKFYMSLFFFIIVSAIIMYRNYEKTGNVVNPLQYSLIILIWGVFLAVKAINLLIFNANWEKKMIEKNMNN